MCLYFYVPPCCLPPCLLYCLSVYMHVCVFMDTCVHVPVFTYISLDRWMESCMYGCMHACECMHRYVVTYVGVCMFLGC